jgi:peptidoglycan/xylan/chitin deacetylase (PgdA/CDA1 family)
MKASATKKKVPGKKTARKKPRQSKVPVEALIVQASWALPRRRLRPHFDFSFILVIGGLLIVGALGFNYVSADNQLNQRLQLDAVSLSKQAGETHYFYTERLEPLITALNQFETSQTNDGVKVVSKDTISDQIEAIKSALLKGNFHQASTATTALHQSLASWQQTLTTQLNQHLAAKKLAATVIAPAAAGSRALQVPILVYHQTPSDFEQQLLALKVKNYTTITFAQLTAAWAGAALPAKPIIITFDDGYANQMTAFDLLEKYQMKATFYIIDGGPLSNWCIGAGRQYNLPSQPPNGCGDAYLNWDQVRQLDQSGIITIGSHTIDHPDLPTETADQQRSEIAGGKAQLEAQLGHSVYTFAYPYGDYNATTISIVQQAGFTTAVTTAAGTLQSAVDRYTLDRVRSAYTLP